MADGNPDHSLDPEPDKALSDLLEQARKEDVSPRLRELVRRLEAALAEARDKNEP